jgi:hypothetical protein
MVRPTEVKCSTTRQANKKLVGNTEVHKKDTSSGALYSLRTASDGVSRTKQSKFGAKMKKMAYLLSQLRSAALRLRGSVLAMCQGLRQCCAIIFRP